MRYPLVFGILTALVATGMILNMASVQRNQRRVAIRKRAAETFRLSYRHSPSTAPRKFATALVSTARESSNPFKGCCTEADYSQRTQVDKANLFRKLGWVHKTANGQVASYPVSVAAAQSQVIRPVAHPSTFQWDTSHSPQWHCAVGYEPSQQLSADLERAARVIPSATSRAPESALAYRDFQFRSDWGLPSDAEQSDWYPSGIESAAATQNLLIAARNIQVKRSQAAVASRLMTSAQQWQLNLTDPENAWQLVINSLPHGFPAAGCGISLPLVNPNPPQRLEQAVLDSVCELGHVHPSQIQFDPFATTAEPWTTAGTVGSARRKPISLEPVIRFAIHGLHWETRQLQHRWNRWTQSAATQWNLGNDASLVAAKWKATVSHWYAAQRHHTQQSMTVAWKSWDRPAKTNFTDQLPDWNYLADLNLPTIGNSSAVWQFANQISQLRTSSNRFEATPIQPVPAANNLGIRWAMSRIQGWVGRKSQQVAQGTLESTASLQNWGMQQNAALERMVMQQEDTLQR